MASRPAPPRQWKPKPALPVVRLKENTVQSEFGHACFSGELERAKELLGKGAKVNYLFRLGLSQRQFTPLGAAVKEGNTEVVEWLVSLRGLEVDCQDEEGFTALHRAMVRRDKRIIDLLLNAGADSRIQTLYKKDAMQMARDHGLLAKYSDLASQLLLAAGSGALPNRHPARAVHRPKTDPAMPFLDDDEDDEDNPDLPNPYETEDTDSSAYRAEAAPSPVPTPPRPVADRYPPGRDGVYKPSRAGLDVISKLNLTKPPAEAPAASDPRPPESVDGTQAADEVKPSPYGDGDDGNKPSTTKADEDSPSCACLDRWTVGDDAGSKLKPIIPTSPDPVSATSDPTPVVEDDTKPKMQWWCV